MVNHVRLFRKRRQLTQEQLAEKAGLTRQSITSIENGKYEPSLKNAIKLSRALDVDLFDLFILDGDIYVN